MLFDLSVWCLVFWLALTFDVLLVACFVILFVMVYLDLCICCKFTMCLL